MIVHTPVDRNPPFWFIQSAIRNRGLVWALARKEFQSKYRGSLFGPTWVLMLPLLMLGIYAFVFTVIFTARWPVPTESRTTIVTAIFSGLLVYTFFSECVLRAPSLLTSNAVYIKKVVFPIEILPIAAVLSTFGNFAVAIVGLLIFIVAVEHRFPIEIIALPLVLAPFVLATLAAVVLLSCIGLFFRDLGQIVSVISTALLFLSPVFYPLEMVPAQLRWAMYLNPLTLIVEQMRALVLSFGWPSLLPLAAYTVIALLCVQGSYWVFAKARRGFSDVV